MLLDTKVGWEHKSLMVPMSTSKYLLHPSSTFMLNYIESGQLKQGEPSADFFLVS